MDNKKVDVLFGIVVIAFLGATFLLIKDFKAQRANDVKEYTAFLQNLERQKNNRIILIGNQLRAERKENEELKATLSQTRNDLDSLSKKLAQQAPAPIAVPTSETTAVTTATK